MTRDLNSKFHVSPCHLLCKDIVDSSFSLHLNRREDVEKTLEKKYLFCNNYFARYMTKLTTFLRRLPILFFSISLFPLLKRSFHSEQKFISALFNYAYFRREIVERCFSMKD